MRPGLGGYRLVRLADAPEVGEEDVLAFWEREGALHAGRDGCDRLAEVSVVALDDGDRLAAVSTVYLSRDKRLRTEMWHLREFVGGDHRGSALAGLMVAENLEYLEQRFVAGDDMRAPGLLMVIENRAQKGRNEAVWKADWVPGVRFTFIGENKRGDHIRVHWFPGARVA